jgi:hypothetical protein
MKPWQALYNTKHAAKGERKNKEEGDFQVELVEK